MTFESGENK